MRIVQELRRGIEMKKLMVVAAMAVAGCAGGKPEETALPPGYVALATFTGEADLQAGTLTIETSPVGGASSAGMKAITVLDADVTVANNGAAWMNKTDGCGSGLNSWGASVNVTSNLAILSATSLSGVYAEITAISSTGSAGCNSAPAPTGLSATNGLWSYGLITAGSTVPVTWEFRRESGTRVTFSGRIVGVKANPANVSSGSQRPVAFAWNKLNVIAANGTTVVVGGGTSGIDFVDSSTGAFSKTASTSAAVTALAVASSRIWYVTAPTATNFVIGWMDRDGTNSASATVSPTLAQGALFSNLSVNTVIPDPGNENAKVWLLAQDASSHSYLWSYTVGTGLGTQTTITGALCYSAALGTDGRIYVPGGTQVIPFSIAADPATPETAISTGANCSVPFYISCRGNDRIVSMTNAGVFALVGSISGPFGFAVSASEVWAATPTGIKRVAATAYDAAISGGTTYAVTLANGYLWTSTNGFLWRVTTQ
jgi:hypothetical protein